MSTMTANTSRKWIAGPPMLPSTDIHRTENDEDRPEHVNTVLSDADHRFLVSLPRGLSWVDAAQVRSSVG